MTRVVSLESVRRANRRMILGHKPDMAICGDKVTVRIRTSVYEGTISFSKKEMREAGAKALRNHYAREKGSNNGERI